MPAAGDVFFFGSLYSQLEQLYRGAIDALNSGTVQNQWSVILHQRLAKLLRQFRQFVELQMRVEMQRCAAAGHDQNSSHTSSAPTACSFGLV